MPNARSLAALAIGLLASSAHAQPAPGQPAEPGAVPVQPRTPADAAEKPTVERETLFDWSEVVTGVRLARGFGANAVVVQGPTGAVLIDTKLTGTGPTLRRESESFGTALVAVVNTTSRPDSTGGNATLIPSLPVYALPAAAARVRGQLHLYLSAFKQPGFESIKAPIAEAARARAQAEMGTVYARRMKLRAEDFMPTRELLAGGRSTVELAGVAMEIIPHAGPTDAQAALRIPSLNVLIAGAAVSAGEHPEIENDSGGSIRAWRASLAELLASCDEKTRVIPAYGAAGGRELISAQLEYFEKLERIVRHAKDVDGMSRTEVGGLKTGAFEGLSHPERLPRNLVLMFDEL